MDNNYRADNARRGGYICGNYYCMTHVIRQGDTLYKLSREYGVKVSALMMANPFVDIYNLRIGDELCIPRLRSVEPMSAARPMPNMNTEPTPVPAAMPDTSYNENDRVIDAEMQMDRNQVMPDTMNNSGRMEENMERMRMQPENWNQNQNKCSKCGSMGYLNQEENY